MIKDKPEVGDVWLGAYKHYVSAVAQTENLDCFYVLYLNGNKQIIGNWLPIAIIKEHKWKYLGKSKANINELFKTENEKWSKK